MEVKEAVESLTNLFKDQDWFAEVGTDIYNRPVVYIKYTCNETLNTIPDRVDSYQVLVHFIGSKTATKDKFMTNATHVPFSKPVVNIEELPSSDLVRDIGELTAELDRLEKVCGSNILQDIFYEVHDGKNAVTNLAARYPEVKDKLVSLYDEYGFDVIYDELDG